MKHTLHITTLITISIVSYVIYYFLLSDNCLHTSISSIIASTHNMAIKQHIIVLGFLPVYIAAMIFGAAMLGIYVGSRLQQYFSIRMNKNNSQK